MENRRIKSRILNFYFLKSISFFPALLSVLFICAAIIILHFERQGLSRELHKVIESIIITNNETARTTLNSIIAGMISLTVFSFTMVMVVLNQTGTNYSPRLIPGLITYRSNQIVLGFYLGTILYSLIILINIASDDLAFNVPGASIFLGVIFSIISLALFVYFIHSISQSIQIGSIMENIYRQSLKSLKENIKKNHRSNTEPDLKKWYPLKSLKSGFLQDFNEDMLCATAVKHDIIIKFLIPPGFYVLKGMPFIQLSRDNSQREEVTMEILKSFSFGEKELIGINYLYGFKHLSEIAVKALSPAINDPGTAARALNYLSELLIELMYLSDLKITRDDEGKPRVIIYRQSMTEMLSAYLSPVRNYGSRDLTIMKKMLEMMYDLLYLSRTDNLGFFSELYEFTLSVIEDADRNIDNKFDREILNSRIKQINLENFFKESLPYL